MKDHPLFPGADGKEAPEVGWVHVTRLTSAGQVWAPDCFPADELLDLGTIQQLFGGGTYELIGRDPDRKRIVARVRYRLDGKPKPLRSVDGSDDGDELEHAAPPVAHPMPAATGSGASDQLMLALMQMMMQMSQQQTQMMVAMLTKGDQASKEHLQAMSQLYSQMGTSQAALFAKVLETAGGGGGGGGLDGFLKGVEYAAEVQQGIAEARGDGEEKDSSMADLLEGLKLFMAMDAQQQAQATAYARQHAPPPQAPPQQMQPPGPPPQQRPPQQHPPNGAPRGPVAAPRPSSVMPDEEGSPN